MPTLLTAYLWDIISKCEAIIVMYGNTTFISDIIICYDYVIGLICECHISTLRGY